MAIVKNEKKATLESFNDFERTFQEKGLFSINSKVTEPFYSLLKYLLIIICILTASITQLLIY